MLTKSTSRGANGTGTGRILATTPLLQEQKVARLGDRVVAAVMDGVVFFPIFAATPALAAYLYRIPRTPEGMISLEGGPALLSMTLDAVLWCTYYFVSEWLFSTSLGKEAMAIEVRSRNGGRCSAIDSFLRNLFRPIDAFGFYLVGFLVAAFSALNQRIGDRVAKTVVKEKPSARRGRAVIGWILLNILLGFAAFSATKLVQKAGTTVWPIEFEQAKSLADSFMSDLVANRLEDASRKMFVDMGHDKTAEAIDSAFRICGHPTDGKFDHTQLGEFTTENGSKTPMRKLYYFTPTTENPEGRCSFFFEVIADRNGKYKIASLGVSKAIL